MRPQSIRAIAVCVIRKDDSVFVFEDTDTVTKQVFYRPLGGGIEYGEHSINAVRREFREEINAELLHLRYLQTLENIFVCDGETGHEIVIVYAGEFADPALYEQDINVGVEDNGEHFKALWMPFADFRTGKFPLYPAGLLELLENDNN